MVFCLRPATSADADFLAELYAASRQDLAALPELVRSQLIAVQFAARRRGYAAAFPERHDRIVEVDGRAVGRLLVHDGDGLRTLVDVSILPDARGHGLGTALVERAIAEARGVPVALHVARDNPAARLYRRLGFEAVGGDGVYAAMRRRPTWPEEDA